MWIWKETMTKTAVLYVRVSTADQADNFSLGTQETACRKYCEANGLSVAPCVH